MFGNRYLYVFIAYCAAAKPSNYCGTLAVDQAFSTIPDVNNPALGFHRKKCDLMVTLKWMCEKEKRIIYIL
jgi:hypothetical protein